MARVLLAVEDSEASIRAARGARRLFGASAEYYVVNVGALPATWAVPDGGFGAVYPWSPAAWAAGSPGDDEALTEEAVHVAERVVEAAGLRAQPLADLGDPVGAIVEAAERLEVDVIVVGSHERGWMGRLLSGSVSEGVVRASHIPVLVVK